MAYKEVRFRVPLGLCDPSGVHLLWYIASLKPEVPGLILSPLFGQDSYRPETTLVEVPAWPASLVDSQATLAFSLLDNGPFHVACPRKPAESFCPPYFLFLHPALSKRSSCLAGHSGTAGGGTSGRGDREARILGPAEGCTIRPCWRNGSGQLKAKAWLLTPSCRS